MIDGNWIRTGEAIGFDNKHVLINGYHRLNACIQSNVTFKSTVTYNLPQEARLVMDTGKSRSSKEVLELSGVSVKNQVINAISPFYFRGRTGMKNIHRLSPVYQAKIYEQFKPALEFAAELLPKERQQLVAAVARAYYSVDKEVLKRFAEIIRTGTTEEGLKPEDNAAVLVRNVFHNVKKGGTTTRTSRELFIKAEKGVHAFVTGKKISRLNVAWDDEEELFPLPHEMVKELPINP
jgi:hypothetical protein